MDWTLPKPKLAVKAMPLENEPELTQFVTGPAGRLVETRLIRGPGSGMMDALTGLLPWLTSKPSEKVSPSVSTFSGSLPVLTGLTNVPVSVSTPSRNPSPSVSTYSKVNGVAAKTGSAVSSRIGRIAGRIERFSSQGWT